MSEQIPPCRIYRPGPDGKLQLVQTITSRDQIRRPVGRPRIHPPKAHPHAGKGRGWNRKAEVTAERINELRERGLKVNEIAAELGCSRFTVMGRLRRAYVPKEAA